jgi:hypothetical protein
MELRSAQKKPVKPPDYGRSALWRNKRNDTSWMQQ